MTYKDLPAPPRSNKQVQEYVAAVEKGSRSQFVMRTRGGWSVRPGLSKGPGRLYESQEEAMVAASTKAAAQHGEVFVFDEDGELVQQ